MFDQKVAGDPWELGFETRAQAEDWRRFLSAGASSAGGGSGAGGSSSLLATVGRTVGLKMFNKKNEKSEGVGGTVGAPFNVVKQNMGRKSSIGPDEPEAMSSSGFGRKFDSSAHERKSSVSEDAPAIRWKLGQRAAKKKEVDDAYEDIDVQKLHVELQNLDAALDDDYETLQPPDEEAPRPRSRYEDDGMEIDTAVFELESSNNNIEEENDDGMDIDTAVFSPDLFDASMSASNAEGFEESLTHFLVFLFKKRNRNRECR